MSGIEKLQFEHAHTLYFSLRDEKVFCMKILSILPKFHEKTLSCSGDIRIFAPGKNVPVHFPHL